MILEEGKGIMGGESGASACGWQNNPGSGGGRAVQSAEKTGKLARGTKGPVALIKKSSNNFYVL